MLVALWGSVGMNVFCECKAAVRRTVAANLWVVNVNSSSPEGQPSLSESYRFPPAAVDKFA